MPVLREFARLAGARAESGHRAQVRPSRPLRRKRNERISVGAEGADLEALGSRGSDVDPAERPRPQSSAADRVKPVRRQHCTEDIPSVK